MSDALDALFQALVTQLSGSVIWADRVRPEYIPNPDEHPAVMYTKVGGGEDNVIHKHDPEFLIDVQCVSSGAGANRTALDAAAEISTLLDNQGSQDIDDNDNPGQVTGDDDWVITTITQGERLHNIGNLKNGEPVYQSGHEFRITMEEI